MIKVSRIAELVRIAELDLPLLMIDREGLIIMALKEGTDTFEGFVVDSENDDWQIGDSSTSWRKDYFKPYTDELTLSNGDNK